MSAPPALHPSVAPPPRAALAPGEIVGSTLALFFQRLHWVMLLTLPAAVCFTVVVWLLTMEFDRAIIVPLRARLGLGYGEGSLLIGLSAIVLGAGMGLALATGPLRELFERFHSGQAVRAGVALRALRVRPVRSGLAGIGIVLAVLLPLIVVSMSSLGDRAGLIVFFCVLGVGFYGIGRWGMMLPVLHEPGTAAKVRQRTSTLSDSYRWQIGGTALLLVVIGVLVAGLMTAALGLATRLVLIEWLEMNALLRGLDDLLLLLLGGLNAAVLMALTVLGLIAMHARMVEIKEPPDITKMVEVFD